MGNKKSFGDKLEKFFAGKGFYIVLLLCVAVIGVSAVILLHSKSTDVETASGTGEQVEQVTAPAVGDSEAAAPQTSEEPALNENTDDSSSLDAATSTEQTGSWTDKQAETAVSAQYVWPLNGTIEVPYSVKTLLYNEKLGDWRTHNGIDISAPLGTQVVAVSAGKVESISKDDLNGTTVVIEHAGGLCSIYSNLAATPTVCKGDDIMTGEVIGAVGSTAAGETKENPHLCFKMTLDGQSVNPSDYLPAK